MKISIQHSVSLPGKGMMKRRKLLKSYRDMANVYKRKHKDVSTAVYRDLMKSFARKMMKAIIEEQYHYVLPYKLGFICVSGHRKNLESAPVDWKASNNSDKIIKHKNLHSDRYVFKFRWTPHPLGDFVGRKFYQFIPTVKNKAHLSSHIKACSEDPYKKNYVPKYGHADYYY